MKVNQDMAVSPVVGVMLMLVVTIIIAAVVSAFAGGLGGSTSKSPQVSLEGAYSISKGLSITNTGGDALSLNIVNFQLYCSNAWGSSASKMRSTLNESQFVDSSGATAGWLRPGETIYILPPYSEAPWLQPGVSKTYWYNASSNIGKPIVLEVMDSSGHAVTSTEITITS